jgi:hypothetical protein
MINVINSLTHWGWSWEFFKNCEATSSLNIETWYQCLTVVDNKQVWLEIELYFEATTDRYFLPALHESIWPWLGTLAFLTNMLSNFHLMDLLLFYWRCVRAAVALDQAYEARRVLSFRTRYLEYHLPWRVKWGWGKTYFDISFFSRRNDLWLDISSSSVVVAGWAMLARLRKRSKSQILK